MSKLLPIPQSVQKIKHFSVLLKTKMAKQYSNSSKDYRLANWTAHTTNKYPDFSIKFEQVLCRTSEKTELLNKLVSDCSTKLEQMICRTTVNYQTSDLSNK